MHLRSFVVENFGPIRKLRWDPGENTAGWHVFIGDNGAGKSTLLKALSLAMVGDDGAKGLRISPRSLVTTGKLKGSVGVVWSNGMKFRYDTDKGYPITRWGGALNFQASFGPTRRFTGNGMKSTDLRRAYPEVARHLSLFDDDWALSEMVGWLKDLKLDQTANEETVYPLNWIKAFINNSDLLPNGVRLDDVTSVGPVFVDSKGVHVSLTDLSDGYQSVLGLTLELLRQLAEAEAEPRHVGGGNLAVLQSGIVLIDEIDAHLHPTWQQRIGSFFTEHFPNMQFLVTTHSPLVCRAATKGSIFRLPRPSDPEDEGGMVTGVDRDRLIYGDVLDAYGTEVFGRGVARSEDGRKKLERLGELNVKARFGEVLNTEEQTEQRELRAIFTQAPLSPEDL
jgi:hypothetical protein